MHKRIWRALVIAACIAGSITTAMAAMKINLKDGRTIDVPVNTEDIVSISFDQSAPPLTDNSTGITWNFESGDLRGWEATGNAFAYQPTYGDNPTARHRGQPSHHEGNYWIGGYEKRPTPNDPAGAVQGDGPQGTLVSQPFTIRTSSISFLIGGGCDINTERVEILVDGRVVQKATGKCTETMERVRLNVASYIGRSAQIRLVDISSGGWGHINFDDLRFE
ncbi:MAG: hypothetical protein LWW87_09820 [Geobacteraceae bacterium]|nr:hypothetical protein [Geobacteraceae bacterium]